MDDKPKYSRRISRRNFVGAVGAAAAASVLSQRGRSGPAPSQTYYYQDSFGNVGPAGQDALNLGVYPPPVPADVAPWDAANPETCGNGTAGTTYYACTYPMFNILLIMVDQMRNPAFWLPSGNNWVTTYGSILPNLTSLAKGSFSFPNYWVAATACTPSRACLLTGLYSQQTCMFITNDAVNGGGTPPLLPYNNSWNGSNNASVGFPTIGNVLSQLLPIGSSNSNVQYDCTWIGKWHVSCANGTGDGSPGENGPSDYGFNATYSIPNTGTGPHGYAYSSAYPSPNGMPNEGSGGDFLDSFVQGNGNNGRDVPNWAANLSWNNNVVNPVSNYSQLNDAAIAWAFTQSWLPNASNNLNGSNGTQLTTPWFCAVSFVNPHDMNAFPWAFAVTSNNSGANFQTPTQPPANAYQPPPVNNSSNNNYYGNDCTGGNNTCASDGDVTTINIFPGSLYSNSLPPGLGSNGHWNFENIGAMLYSNNGKPGLQQYFLNEINAKCGVIMSPGSYNNTSNNWSTPGAWATFLNYYAWLESNVDYQIGQVITALQGNATFWANTVIIFTSDHGDYAGSHGLHAKAGALYEEALNVPLLVSMPSLRSHNSGPHVLPYVCSGVDLLPFLYTLALGNSSWRTNSSDMIYYLANRENIEDAIYAYDHANNNYISQRRLSSIPLYSAHGSNNLQPFVLHTTDEYNIATQGGNYQPSHAIAFRTVDQTDPNNNSAPFAGQTSYGGGKLGIYSYWDTCNQNAAPIQPFNNATNQYEFYNYSPHPSTGNLSANPQETHNQYFDSSNNTGYSAQGQAYLNDWSNNGSQNGINIQNELYNLYSYNNSSALPTKQVAAATQVAFSNYIQYLACQGYLTGNNTNAGYMTCSGNNNNSGTCPNCSLYSNNCGNYTP